MLIAALASAYFDGGIALKVSSLRHPRQLLGATVFLGGSLLAAQFNSLPILQPANAAAQQEVA